MQQEIERIGQPQKPKETDRTDLFLPIKKAKEKGATDEQILTAISSKYPDYSEKIIRARNQGASDEQIFKAISRRPTFTEQPLRKVGRVASQAAIGAAEGATIGYNVAASLGHMIGTALTPVHFQQQLSDHMNHLLDMKAIGIFDEEDQSTLDYIQDLIKNPEKQKQFLPEDAPQIDVGSLAEKAFETQNIDMEPEDLIESAARWSMFLKDPKKLGKAAQDFYKDPKKPLDLIKAVKPTLTEASRGFGAGIGMEIAKEGHFGLIGSIVATILGDISGGLASKAPKLGKSIIRAGAEYASDPSKYNKKLKKGLAEGVAWATERSRKDIGDSVASSMKQSGVEADIGTLTNSNVMKVIQTQLENSGLVGNDLDELRTRITNQFEKEYKKIANELGEYKYATNEEAGQAILSEARSLNIPMPTKERLVPSKHRPLKGRIDTKETPEYAQNFLSSISSDEFEDFADAIKTIRKAAQNIQEPMKKKFKKGYKSVREKTTKILFNDKKLVTDLKKFVSENSGSLLQKASPVESKVVNVAEDLIKILEGKKLPEKDYMGMVERAMPRASQKAKDSAVAQMKRNDLSQAKSSGKLQKKTTTVSNLMFSKSTLSDIADYDFGGSNFAGKYKYLVQLIDESIVRELEKKDPALAKKLKNLNAEFSEYKKIFENEHVMPLFEKNNKNYHAIHKSLLKPDPIKAVEALLQPSLEGSYATNLLKKDYAKSILSKKDLSPRDLRDLKVSVGFGGSIKKLSDEMLEAKKGLQAKKVKTPVPKDLRPKAQGKPPLREIRAKISEKQYFNNIANLVGKKSPEQIFNMMNQVSTINTLERLLSPTERGRKLFNSLKRLKFEKIVGEHMIDSTTNQLKVGTFSKLLEKGNNREIVKRLLGEQGYKDFVNLQNNAGSLAASGQKFYNSSKTATSKRDYIALMSLMSGILTGNVWMAAKVGSGLTAAKKVASLLADKEFLEMTREAIISNKQNNPKRLQEAWEKILNKFNEQKVKIPKDILESKAIEAAFLQGAD